jgi:hypothetical protein
MGQTSYGRSQVVPSDIRRSQAPQSVPRGSSGASSRMLLVAAAKLAVFELRPDRLIMRLAASEAA